MTRALVSALEQAAVQRAVKPRHAFFHMADAQLIRYVSKWLKEFDAGTPEEKKLVKDIRALVRDLKQQHADAQESQNIAEAYSASLANRANRGAQAQAKTDSTADAVTAAPGRTKGSQTVKWVLPRRRQ